MFPHEQEALDRPSLFCLPTLHSHPRSLGGTVSFQNQSNDNMRRHHDSQTPAASPEWQRFRSLQDRPRGRSYEEGVHLHTKLPSVASLMSSSRQVQEHRPQLKTLNSIVVSQQQGLSDYLTERRRAQTLPQMTSPIMTSSLSMEQDLVPTSLSGLSTFADPHLLRSRYAVSPSNYSSRWSPYASMPTSRYVTRDPIATPWDDLENEGAQQNHRRRRTSPRQRLAASKARAHAMQMTIEREQVRHFERSYEAPTPFVPQTPTSMGLSVPMAMPPHPPSSVLVDEFDTSPSKKSSRYLREMDRRSILARLERGEKQSALAKEFRVTRAAICNLNKHRDLVLSRQHEDPLTKHPKKPRSKQESEYYTEAEDAAGPNWVSLSDTQTVVHKVTSQPAERLIPLLLSSDISDSAFRGYCDRLMTLIVEEVLAWTHTETHNQASCGVAIAPGGSPMLSIFQTLEPELPVGHIKLNLPQLGSSVVEMIDLPSAVTSHNVFLFYAFTDTAGGFRVAKSIRKLLDRGAMEEWLCLVTLAASTFTIGELQREYPNLRIAAAHIEHEDQHDPTSQLHTLASRVAEIY